MKKVLIATIFVIGVLLLSATALPVSAGVEPSPFRDKTVVDEFLDDIYSGQNVD